MTYYEVLGVSPRATAGELRRAYVDLARRHHPDYHASSSGEDRRRAEREMQRINEAWQVLGDAARRADYDRRLAAPVEPPPRPRATGGRAHPEFVPFDDDDDEPDPRLLDDGPLPGVRPVPRWQQVLPPALLVLAVAAGAVGLVTSIRAVLAFAVLAFLGSLAGFGLTPLLELLRGYDPHPER